MPLIAYPNVPMVLGVPLVPRSGLALPTPTPALVSADGASTNQQQTWKWGIYDPDTGQPILIPDSVVSLSYMQEYRISDYPVEQGAFESYNKVATPFDARVVFTKGGSRAARTDFLNQLGVLLAALNLWDVVTPEKTYNNVNVVRYDYDRSASNGVSLLKVSIFLREVRITSASQQSGATAPLANTQAPSGADTAHVGTVQAVTADLSLSQRIKQGLRPW